MEDRETVRMRKYGERKTTRIMMATVPHVTSGLGFRKFQSDGFLLTRVYMKNRVTRGGGDKIHGLSVAQEAPEIMRYKYYAKTFPCYLVPLRPKYSPQHPILKHSQRTFLPQCQRPSFTPIQNNRQNYSSVLRYNNSL